jgi:hypothetical protein
LAIGRNQAAPPGSQIAARAVGEIEVGRIQPRPVVMGGNAEDRVHVQAEERAEPFHVLADAALTAVLPLPNRS